ncbi:1-deoxy-D-xylulose-5-phosphate reductoisomerase [Streptomyces noursei]|uniref:1-deoxy-D-xylulose-5-phosphate reductoisomerase n=1 Tax=Streptomyces noursei TaxID=1971 RepID=UPI00167698D9|nr:1-deoxy-D-xylulose-5-phosphate reductoisomerase [Streptomyces noursei]MCZ1014131.1 1-deoxy-D-xylulose-5-phosphate reductoisomerase [Streptomyces noursei]GGX24235.1 1-deoxy-D-xylulose 5-phosphate reductoisomerase [Streptomyces noursei]
MAPRTALPHPPGNSARPPLRRILETAGTPTAVGGDDGVRAVVVLGSTGSVGSQALDVITAYPGRFRAVGLAAGGGRPDLLARQALRTGAKVVAVTDPAAVGDVTAALAALVRKTGRTRRPLPMVLAGPQGLAAAAAWSCDIVLNALPGAAGLPASLTALEAGRCVALANKESLVTGGELIRRVAGPGQIVPVDSEHSAIMQCLPGWAYACPVPGLRRLVLTCSGGPFRNHAPAQLAAITPAQALKHPTWRMGPLVTVNSATLVNKGLEIIEAQMLFGLGYDRITAVIHPQSAVHSMAEYADGSTLAQAAPPNMRLPIATALAWPHRPPPAVIPPLDWTRAHTWTFEPVDEARFPAVALAHHAGRLGGSAPTVFNAANEEAVAAFLNGTVPFPAITQAIEHALDHHIPVPDHELTLDTIRAADAWARRHTHERLHQPTPSPAYQAQEV